MPRALFCLPCAALKNCLYVHRQTRGARSGCLGSSTLARYGSCRSTTWCGPPAASCAGPACAGFLTPGVVSTNRRGTLGSRCVQLVS